VDPVADVLARVGRHGPGRAGRRATSLDDLTCSPPPCADMAQFTPQLLAAGGPVNQWTPTPNDSQIAYGVDCRVEGLVATAKAAHAPGLLHVAAVTAAWFFGANPGQGGLQPGHR